MNHILKVLPNLSVCLLSAPRCQSEERALAASRWHRPTEDSRAVAGFLRWKKCICGRLGIPPPPMHSCGIRIEWRSSNSPMNPPVCWHRPKPVFQGLPPSAYSFHVLQSVFECLTSPHFYIDADT